MTEENSELEEQKPSKISAECRLGSQDLAHVRDLVDTVRRVDGVELKLNWDLMAKGIPDQISNFCCYDDGRVIGYALLEGDGSELEFTAAVSPAFRRQGTLRLLLNAAKKETLSRLAKTLLLVNYRASTSGVAAVLALGLPYVSSEYRMEAEAAALPLLHAGLMKLAQVEASDVVALARIMDTTFGREPSSPAALGIRLEQVGSRYFFAELDGVRIGQIGVVDTEDSIYIRGLGVLPEYRRRGYGRQMLAATLQAMLSEGHTRFLLDVVTDNVQALSLYQSCGFHPTNIYDYHDVPLLEPT